MNGNKKALLRALFLTLVFVLMTTLLSRNRSLTILTGVSLGVIAGVIKVYSPLVFSILKTKTYDRSSQIVLGIVLLFASVAGSRLWWIAWRLNGAPDTWRAHPIYQSFVMLVIIAGALFITAPGYPANEELEIPKFGGSNFILLIVHGSIGAIITVTFSMFNSNPMF